MKFRDFIVLQRGFDLPRSHMEIGPYPVIGSTTIIGYHSKYKILPPGVITGRSGSLGKIQYVSVPYWPHNTSLWVKDFKGNHPRFVYYYLHTLDLAQFNAGAGVPTLNRNHLDSLEVIIPSLPIQKKIASILSAYDDMIENNLRRIRILEEMAQNLYREWFVKFRFPGYKKTRFVDSPLGKIPEGWKVNRFTEEVDVMSGGTPKTSIPEFWNGEIPWMTPKDIKESFYVIDTERKITESGLKKCNSILYPSDTVFITARGTVGRCVLSAVPMAMSQTSYALIGRKGTPQYYVYLMTLEIVDALKKSATGAVFDTIIIDTFKRHYISFPPIELRFKFVEKVIEIFVIIRNLLYKNITLRRTRDLLLPKLISGEVDVSELDIKVPEE